MLHLATGNNESVHVTIEIDVDGTGKWTEYKSIPVGDYASCIFPADFKAQWARLKTDKDCVISAYFHLTDAGRTDTAKYADLFAGLTAMDAAKPSTPTLIYPAKRNRNLDVISGDEFYQFTKTSFEFVHGKPDAELKRLLAVKTEASVDEASVIVTHGKNRLRLPKGSAAYDKQVNHGEVRMVRELESERNIVNVHGTFYEMPRDTRFAMMRPIASHNKNISDFCTWSGLLVLACVEAEAKADEHIYKSQDGKTALWFGGIDDLWKLGKPVGTGGPWKNTAVKAHMPSDAYLMTGYDKKRVEITADKDTDITLAVDFDHQTGFHTYKSFAVKAGEKLNYEFPEGFSAHWIRAVSEKDCTATVWFVYE